MGRAESKATNKQALATSTQDQSNAQETLKDTNTALGNYGKNLNDFMVAGQDAYGPGGEYAKTMSTLGTSAASAGSRNMAQQLAMRSLRTGENTAGYAPAAAEAQRQASRDLTETLAQQNASRMDKLTALRQIGLDASKFPAQVQASLYGPSVSGAVGALSPAAAAAQHKGLGEVFGDAFLNSLGQGLGSAAVPSPGG